MDRVRAVWRRYRGWPLWAQIPIGIIVGFFALSIALTPFVDPEDTQKVSAGQATTTATEAPMTTLAPMTAPPTTVAPATEAPITILAPTTAPPTTVGPTSTAVPVTNQPAPTTAAAPVQGTTTPGLAECSDPARDVPQAGSDITKVTLRSDGTALSVMYDLNGMPTAPPDGASWILKVQVDGGGIYQLGLKLVGREAFRFVFDFGGRQENLSPTYTAESGRLLVAFPIASFRAVGKNFSWSATTTYAGADIDNCPENGTVRFVA